MKNNTGHFIEEHPDCKSVIALYFIGWKADFGEDIYIDVAESREDAEARYKFYTANGLKLVDENCFGKGAETVGIAQCYVPKEHNVVEQYNNRSLW